MSQLPPTSFLLPRAARVEQARQRYFDDGHLPTGVVSEAVFESWSRCLRLHHNPRDKVVFQPVTVSRAQLALQKNRDLHQAWHAELPRLGTVLGTTSCAAMLTDSTGVLIGATCARRSHEKLMSVAHRAGVNMAEEAVGTTAPGVVIRSGKAACVQGAEHFFESVKAMQCAAAPIRGINGRLAGVLDISSETIPFSFDAAAVVGLYAGVIENRLLVAQSMDHLVIHFQVAEELLNSPLVGMVGIDSHGGLAWQNGVARSLLGQRRTEFDLSEPEVETMLGLSWGRLASLPLAGAELLTLPNGLVVWARAEMRSADGRRNLVAGSSPHTATATTSAAASDSRTEPDADTVVEPTSPVSADGSRVGVEAPPATATLRQLDRALIERTLERCGGNLSEVARSLSVSRGLIYRRLSRSLDSPPSPTTE